MFSKLIQMAVFLVVQCIILKLDYVKKIYLGLQSQWDYFMHWLLSLGVWALEICFNLTAFQQFIYMTGGDSSYFVDKGWLFGQFLPE